MKVLCYCFFLREHRLLHLHTSCLDQRLELLMKELSEGLYSLPEMSINVIGPQAGSNVYY